MIVALFKVNLSWETKTGTICKVIVVARPWPGVDLDAVKSYVLDRYRGYQGQVSEVRIDRIDMALEAIEVS